MEFEGTYNPRQHKLLFALAAPIPGETIEDTCKRAGYTRDAYYALRRKPEFLRDVAQLGFHLMHGDLPAIYSAAGKEAKNGNVAAMRLLLEAAGRVGGGHKQIVNVTQNAGSGDDLTDWLDRRDEVLTTENES